MIPEESPKAPVKTLRMTTSPTSDTLDTVAILADWHTQNIEVRAEAVAHTSGSISPHDGRAALDLLF